MEKDLDYEILTLGHTFYKNGTKLLTYHLEYLKFLDDTPQFREINQNNYEDVLTRQAYAMGELYHSALEAYAMQSSAFPYVYDSRVHVTMNQDGIFSVYLDEYIFSGGAHGNTIRTAFTMDSRTLEPRTLCSFMKQENCLPCISENIIQQITNSGQIEDYFSNYATLVPQTLDAKNFYVTLQGVVVYFGLYDIAPYVSGIREYTIPFNSC